MKTNHKFMLSLATIAILSGTGALAADVDLTNDLLKDKGSSGVYTPDLSSVTETEKVIIKKTIDKTTATDMTKLNVSTKGSVEVGETSQNAAVSLRWHEAHRRGTK